MRLICPSSHTFQKTSKLIIVHLVVTAIFLLNAFPPSKPDARFSNSKVPGNIFLGTIVDYKKVCRLHPGEHLQVHQEYEHWKKIDINQTVGAIVLGPQYNLHGGYFRVL